MAQGVPVGLSCQGLELFYFVLQTRGFHVARGNKKRRMRIEASSGICPMRREKSRYSVHVAQDRGVCFTSRTDDLQPKQKPEIGHDGLACAATRE